MRKGAVVIDNTENHKVKNKDVVNTQKYGEFTFCLDTSKSRESYAIKLTRRVQRQVNFTACII